jgi:TolB-like protein
MPKWGRIRGNFQDQPDNPHDDDRPLSAVDIRFPPPPVVNDGGRVAHLTPKAFDLLAVLLERAPEVAEGRPARTDLARHSCRTPRWSATIELRRAFGDHDKSAPLIRTSYGIGYAFGGTIEKVDAPPLRPTASVAVLPFVNIGEDPKDTYFSDGLAEELTTALAQLPGLRVAARVSAFQFRDRANELQQIGKALNVDRVLEECPEGRRSSADYFRWRVSTTATTWSAKYDREIGDVFAIQDDIAAAVLSALAPALSGKALPRLIGTVRTSRPSSSISGQHRWHQPRRRAHTAIAHFEAAVRLDRHYALAYAGLACRTRR